MNLMSNLSGTKTRFIMAIMIAAILFNSCEKESMTDVTNVGTIRFAASSYTIELNTLDPLTIVLPLSLPLEEDATAVVTIDDQSTISPDEYTITPAIPAEGIKLNLAKGDTEASFQIASLNNFEGDKTLILKLTTAGGGVTVANTDAVTTLTIKGNPILYPEIKSSVNDLAFGSIITGTIPPSQSYILSGVKLTEDVMINVSSNYQVSLDDINFSSSLTVPFETLNTAPITVHTRFTPNTGINQVINGTITHSSGAVPNAVVRLTGVEYGNATIGVLIKKEDLSYGGTAGSLIPVSGGNWAGFSAIGLNAIKYITPGLSYTGYTGSGVGGALNMQNLSASSEDAGWAFPPQTSGTIYTAQLMNFASAPATTADFFTSLGNGDAPATPLYYNRVYVKANGAQFSIGVSRNANTTAVYSSTNLDYGTTYLVVTKYEFETGNSSMYVLSGTIPSIEPPLPDAASSGGAVDPASLTRVVIRQSTNLPLNVTVDGIRVATSWKEAVGL